MKKIIFSLLSTLTLSTALWQTQTLATQTLAIQSPSHSFEPSYIGPTLLAGRFNRGYRFGVRASRYRRGGFARGDCPTIESFIPLVPKAAAATDTSSVLLQNSLAPTYPSASSHPVFFINLPELPATKATLFIDNANPEVSRNQRQVYKVELELSGEPGIVGIRIPNNAPQLIVGESYLWRLSIACTPESVSNFVRLRGGVITQVAPASGTPDEQLNSYLEQEVWQNLLTTVAENRYQNPGNPQAETDWREFVESSGLETLASVPIVEFIDARFVE